VEFEWDPRKAQANLDKHGIDFEDAVGVFEGPVLEVRSDRDEEERWKAMGEIEGVVLAIVYTRRGERYRIISARRANQDEKRAYRTADTGRPEERSY